MQVQTSMYRQQTTTVPTDGNVILQAHLNCKLDKITITGSDQIEMINSNFGHLYTSYVSPHRFPSVILRHHQNSRCLHDLYFRATPGDTLTITWRETYIPYDLQPPEVHGSNMYMGELVKL